jgi:hypothetical protein
VCKLVTILGGCLVTAGGVGYGLYTYTGLGCDGPCPLAAVAVSSDQAAPCPYSADACTAGTSAGDDGCPLAAAAKATCTTSVGSAGEDECCPLAAAKCDGEAGLQAVAGVALSAGGK